MKARRRWLAFVVTVVASMPLVLALPATVTQAAGDPVIAAAGDITCQPPAKVRANACHQQATADLLGQLPYDAVLPLGDGQYDCGTLSGYQQVYAPTWGKYLAKSHPVVGDQDYGGTTCSVPGASGYFTYFGAAASPDNPSCTSACKGYYSYDIGAWHVVALNSECTQPGVGGCSSTSPMLTWLGKDLAAHPAQCTLAYMHEPYWANGTVVKKYLPVIKALYNAHVDVLLTGHKHIYARYAPQTPTSANDPAQGVREFIVGTGGHNHAALASPLPNLQVSNNTTFGVLQLTLHSSSYDWRFVPEAGQSFTDSGTSACH